jgi:hypothetical protein
MILLAGSATDVVPYNPSHAGQAIRFVLISYTVRPVLG